MDCVYIPTGVTQDGLYEFRCDTCLHVRRGRHADPTVYKRNCGARIAGVRTYFRRAAFAPGAELRKLLQSFGVHEMTGCQCKNKAAIMDAWGVDGCREHFSEIIGWLRENDPKWGLLKKVQIGAKAAAAGLFFNPRDPFPGLVREAIRRAEIKERGQRGPKIRRLNLVYHIMPKPHPLNVWQWNVDQLLKRWHLFSGRKVITVCTGEGLDPPERVQELFPAEVEWIVTPNHKLLRDSVKFQEMLRRLYSLEPTEATFVAHAKGASVDSQHAVRPWTQELYRHCLDRWQEVATVLRSWPIAGPCKQTTHHLGGWHYVGAFYIFRHDAWFGNPAWSCVDNHGWALETHPGTLFPTKDSYCLAYKDIVGPYEPKTWEHVATP